MALVVLDYLFIHLARSPDIFLALDVDGETATRQTSGEVRRLAGGRHRAVVRVGSARPLSLTLEQVDRSDVETLDAWVAAGEFLLLRDPRGRVEWGHIFDLSVDEIPGVDLANVSFTFQPVTHSPEV